jgi:hypothetical protein
MAVSRVAASIVGIIALLSLLLFIHVSATTAWLRVALDASHGPIFAGVAILLSLLLKPKMGTPGAAVWPDWVRYSKVLGLCIALGALIEFLQGFDGRPPSFFDVLTDTAGAMAGLAGWALATRPRKLPSRVIAKNGPWAVIALGLAGMTFVLWRPLHAAVAYAHRAAILPTLAEFTGPLDLYFATTDGSAAAISDLPAPWSRQSGERALALQYDPEHAPAVQLVEPSGDWRGYGVIAVDITNAGPSEVSLVFRILDAHHDWSHADRLNLPLVIPPRTRTTVRVALDAVASAPASRRMDMARIANVMLFGRKPAAPGTLYVSRIWLE